MTAETEAQRILDELRETLTHAFNLIIALGKLAGTLAPAYRAGDEVLPLGEIGAPIYEAWRPGGQVKRATWPMRIIAVDGSWLQVAAPTAAFPLGLWVRAADVKPR